MNTIFSDFEKKVIDKLFQLDNKNSDICLQNMVADNSGLLGSSTDFDFCIYPKENFCLYYLKNLDTDLETDKKFMQEIEKKLYDIVLLFEYLESEKYILIIDSKREPNSKTDYEQNIPLNADLQKRLCNMWNKDIKVLMRLKSLKQHDYLDEKLYELKSNNKRSRFLSLAALGVSIVSILASVLVQCFSVQKVSVESFKDSLEIANRFEAQK